MNAALRVAGIDFTSRPRRAKPITVALGHRVADRVVLERLEAHVDGASLVRFLCTPGPWVAAFDFPFGLPREAVEALGWPRAWRELIAHYTSLSRAQIRATFARYLAARPAGRKFAHRACDAGAGSSSPMKWVNPPVAYMLHAGVPLLLEAGVHLPHLHAGDVTRVALEGYPGLLARELIGRRCAASSWRRRPRRVAPRSSASTIAPRAARRSGVSPVRASCLYERRPISSRASSPG